MENVTVFLPPDRMSALVRISPGVSVTMQDLRDALWRDGVTAGVSPALLQEALNGPRGIFYKVAAGSKPKSIKEGSVSGAHTVWRFPNSIGPPPESLAANEGFKEAFRQIKARGIVNVGDILAFVRNPHAYPKGRTVTDEESVCIEFGEGSGPGKNARVSYDGCRVVATRSGIPYKDSEGHSVLDHFEILGDVSMLTGDVSFPGSLSVRGSIQSGLRVSATGDVLVSGSVHGSVTAKGKLAVSGGISAPGESIEAGEGVICAFIENSIIRSSSKVVVKEAVVHSLVETEDALEVTSSNGRIIGGLVRAERGLKVATIGSAMGLPTLIELGVSPKTRREEERIRMEIDRITQELAGANKAGARRIQSTRDYQAIRHRRLKAMLEDQITSLGHQLAVLEDTVRRSPKGYVRVSRVLPGVRLKMGDKVTEFISPHDKVYMGAIPDEAD